MLSTSQFYGAGKFLPKKYRLIPNVSWTHGVMFSIGNPYTIISREEAVFDIHLVTDQNQANIASKVFPNVYPVGLPFSHALKKFYDSSAEKVFKRLFMSRHRISGEKPSFLKDVLTEAKNLQCDAICIPGDEFNHIFGKKKNSVEYENLILLKGASAKDFDSYERIISLFSRTETLVTDCLGSHPYYAVSCGCKFELHYKKISKRERQEKLIAGTKGLIEPWKSALTDYFLRFRLYENEIEEFSNLKEEEMKIIAFEKIGMEFICNLNLVMPKIEKTSLFKLLQVNRMLFSRKFSARFLT